MIDEREDLSSSNRKSFLAEAESIERRYLPQFEELVKQSVEQDWSYRQLVAESRAALKMDEASWAIFLYMLGYRDHALRAPRR